MTGCLNVMSLYGTCYWKGLWYYHGPCYEGHRVSVQLVRVLVYFLRILTRCALTREYYDLLDVSPVTNLVPRLPVTDSHEATL